MEILAILKERFENNRHRHSELEWSQVEARLSVDPGKLESLIKMEESGGEPDVICSIGEVIVFADCSKESPSGRRSICYDKEARIKRKKFPPETSAEEMLEAIGAEMMDEEWYRFLQSLDDFDFKSSSWIKAPEAMRRQGGALFGDKRYDIVFVYHNGAESYYASRGVRGILKV